jgi:hypothetical protein
MGSTGLNGSDNSDRPTLGPSPRAAGRHAVRDRHDIRPEQKNTATTEAAMSRLIEQRVCLIIVSFRDLNGSCCADFQLTLGVVYQHVNLCCA